MRKFTLLGLIAGLMALGVPAVASAAQPPPAGYGTNCSYAAGQAVAGTNQGGNEVYVYKGTGSTGDPSTSAVGACVNVPAGAGALEGGTVEVGQGPNANPPGGTGTYAVIDGNNANFGQSAGYAALSNYEDTGPDPTPCNGNDNDSPKSTNGGGCIGLKPTGTNIPLPSTVPTPACGDTSGPDWNSTNRDGCFIP